MRTINKTRLFERWLRENRHRFALHPYLIERKDHGITYGLRGVVPEITFHVSDGDISVWAEFHDLPFDMLRDIDILEEHTEGKGYYCGFCTRKRYFKSVENLYISHNFEELLKYVNAVISRSRFIAFFASGGITDARIVKNRAELIRIAEKVNPHHITAILSIRDKAREVD